jgi:predicted  nucleic acid-binding Zn-ribbon protein
MECGKVRSNGLPIFYFVIDPLTPENPRDVRVRTYYVVTHVDSYVEAFYYLARQMATPATSLDEAMARWHSLYCRVFGTVGLDNFRKSLLTVPVEHFHLASTEAAAKELAETHLRADTMHSVANQSAIHAASVQQSATTRYADVVAPLETKRRSPRRYADANSPVRTFGRPDPVQDDASRADRAHMTSRLNASGLLTGAPVYREDAKVELHRLRAEHASEATVGHSRAKVNALSDAERAALMYQLSEARKESQHEKAVAKEASERLRQMTKNLEERLQALVANHEHTLRDRAAAEYERLTEMEEGFFEREKKLQQEYEQALHDRDRKLSKAISRVKVFESHLEDASSRVSELSSKLQETTAKAAALTNERQSLEEDNRRLQRQVHALEMQVEDSTRLAQNADDERRKAIHESADLRGEIIRLRREMERYEYFSHSLHRELQQLDDSAITAAELLRRKVFASRDGMLE